VRQGFPLARARDWAVTAWGVPTIGGEQWAQPGAVSLNLVAPLEMAFNAGVHPRATEAQGPNTGAPRSFRSFDELLAAFQAQLQQVVDHAVRGDTALAQAWQRARPRPLLSALMLGTQDASQDVTEGGARYRATGFEIVGFADVVDCLAAIERVVFDLRALSLDELLRAMALNFEGHTSLHDQLLLTAPKYGDGSAQAQALASKIAGMVRLALRRHDTPLGGPHVPGYCGLTANVVWGRMTGALPSGRLRRQPFAAGAAPSHRTVGSLADRLRHAAAIHADDVPQGFTVAIRHGDDGGDQSVVVDQLVQILRSFFAKGGLVAQLDTLPAQLLRAAAEAPAAFADLMVPVCGYDAYLGTLPWIALDDVLRRAGVEQANGTVDVDGPYDEGGIEQLEEEAEETPPSDAG
jgi:formate C-acetyltransferase